MSQSREIARAVAQTASRAATATTASARGVVHEVLENEEVLVQLPGGAVVTLAMPRHLNVAKGVGLELSRRGNSYSVVGISCWQGGLGAPFPIA